jgi:hypothetical protein
MTNNKSNWSKIRENLLILEMSAANIQGVQWVPGMHDSIVNWSTDLKLYKITVGPREYAPASNSDIVAEYIVNCPALKSELISRITGNFHLLLKYILSFNIFTNLSTNHNTVQLSRLLLLLMLYL